MMATMLMNCLSSMIMPRKNCAHMIVTSCTPPVLMGSMARMQPAMPSGLEFEVLRLDGPVTHKSGDEHHQDERDRARPEVVPGSRPTSHRSSEDFKTGILFLELLRLTDSRGSMMIPRGLVLDRGCRVPLTIFIIGSALSGRKPRE